jgi:hypothetical protein
MPTFLNCGVWRLLIFLPASNTMADSEWVQWDDVANEADAANQTESMGKADLRWRNLNSTTMDDGASCKFETKPVRSEFQENARSAVSTLSVIAKSWFGSIGSGRGWGLIDCRGQKRKARRRVVESGRERGGGERGVWRLKG